VETFVIIFGSLKQVLNEMHLSTIINNFLSEMENFFLTIQIWNNGDVVTVDVDSGWLKISRDWKEVVHNKIFEASEKKDPSFFFMCLKVKRITLINLNRLIVALMSRRKQQKRRRQRRNCWRWWKRLGRRRAEEEGEEVNRKGGGRPVYFFPFFLET